MSNPSSPRSLHHNALPDRFDGRDYVYVPTGSTAESVPLERYLAHGLPVMDQGDEHACTGFGLAAVVHYLLRQRDPALELTKVSPRMIYEMAKRHDEYPGTGDPGSSARGAMKGWHKHGVCSWDLWPYIPDQIDRNLTRERAADALTRPLGAYHRISALDIDATRNAIETAGIVYAMAYVHRGWRETGADGRIPMQQERTSTHAFALVGYDRDGFWLQNSKGPGWGQQGFGHLSNADWVANARDVWVASLGEPET